MYSLTIVSPSFGACLLEAVGDRLPEIVVHGDHRDLHLAELVGDELRGALALRRSKQNAAERPVSLLGDVGMHGVSGDIGNAGLLEDGGGGAGRRRVASGNRGHDLVLADQLVGDRHGLIGLVLVVVDHELDLLAQHAALLVDPVARDLRADRRRLAVGGCRTGLRRVEADLDLRGRVAGKQQCRRQSSGNDALFHDIPLNP